MTHEHACVRHVCSSVNFPPLLREIPDCPTALYVRGNTTLLAHTDLAYLAVVGSREYTAYGKLVTERLIAGLRGYPVVIVSGLALGIDGIAHGTALSVGLPTVAVPGSGLDPRVIYPAAHRSLAERIVESGGALISEFEPLFKPRPESFPRRNRIMAGMSHAVLVVEATERSGTLITARLAAEYNRDVLAVPGSVFTSTSKGPHMLLARGAALITESDDILRTLSINPQAVARTTTEGLSDEETRVIALLRTHPLPRDELMHALNLSVTTCNVLLSSMELKGFITERLGLVTLK